MIYKTKILILGGKNSPQKHDWKLLLTVYSEVLCTFSVVPSVTYREENIDQALVAQNNTIYHIERRQLPV